MAVNVSLADTARAAELRAQACRRRLAALQAGDLPCEADLLRAQAALFQARERAEQARRRLNEAAERYRQVQAKGRVAAALRACGEPAPSASSPGALRAQLRRAELSLTELHDRYLMLGGGSSLFEVDAFMYECGTLPEHELSLLSYTIWEIGEWPQ